MLLNSDENQLRIPTEKEANDQLNMRKYGNIFEMFFPIKCVLLFVSSYLVISKKTCIFSLLVMTIRWRLCSYDVCMSVELFFSRFLFLTRWNNGIFSPVQLFRLENARKKMCIPIPLVYMIFPPFSYATHWLYRFCSYLYIHSYRALTICLFVYTFWYLYMYHTIKKLSLDGW